jgi:hypothetical protein
MENITAKEKEKLIKTLGKFFRDDIDPDQERIKEAIAKYRENETHYGFMDEAAVFMVEFKNKDIETLFLNVFKGIGPKNVPRLDYESQTGRAYSAFDGYYLEKIIKVFNAFEKDNNPTIIIKRDYPGTFENDHLKVVLAPRIDEY